MTDLDILLSFGVGDGPQSASEVIARTGLPRSTVFRALSKMVRSGFLYRDAGSQRYLLGPQVLHLGLVARTHLSSQDVITRPLLELAKATNETITFNLADVPWRACVFALEAPSDLRHVVQVGARYPLHLGAAGRAILAHVSPDAVAGVLDFHGVAGEARREVIGELATIRDAGLAESVGQRVPGAWGIAAPVFLGESIYASVAVAAPAGRVDARATERYRALVRRTAARIGDVLSAKPETGPMAAREAG